MKPMSDDALFPILCRNSGLPPPTPEFRFHPTRKWRYDWAWPDKKVALEVEGGTWINGRHNRGSGFVRDMEKYNAAAVAGWRVLKCVPKDLCTIKNVQMVKEALG